MLAAVVASGFAGCGGGGNGGDGKRDGERPRPSRGDDPAAIAKARRAAAPAHACLTRSGYRVTAGAPRLDDSNAPDYQLVIQRGRDGAFIAFYAQRSRADRHVAGIRRRAQRFGRTAVERRGSITIVWVRLPEERRARVRDCLDA